MFILNKQATALIKHHLYCIIDGYIIIINRQMRMDNITPKLVGAPWLWDCWSEDEKKFL